MTVNRVRLKVKGSVGKSVNLTNTNTVGAIIGSTLRLPDGSVPTLAQLAAALHDANQNQPGNIGSPGGATVINWNAISNIPASITGAHPILQPEEEEPILIPGPQGPRGPTGAQGPSGSSGGGSAVILWPEDPDDQVLVPPGSTTPATAGASSPLTTKGDLYTFSTVAARLGIGSNAQVLTADSTQATGMKWATPSGGTTALPGTIPDCVLWIDGSSFINTAGVGIPVLTNLSPVSSGAFSLQSGSGGGAAVSATQLNSKNVILFPGSSNSIYNIGISGVLLSEFTGFIVWNPTSLGDYGNIICGGNSSLQWVWNQTSGTLSLYQSAIAAIGTSSGAIAAGSWAQANTTYHGATGAYAFRIGRTASGSGTGGANVITTATTHVGEYSSSQYLNGSVAELIIYNRVLTSTEISNVEAYLLAKWGV